MLSPKNQDAQLGRLFFNGLSSELRTWQVLRVLLPGGLTGADPTRTDFSPLRHHAVVGVVWRCLVTDRRNGDLGADGTREPTAGLLMATFDHHTSRELDPQLHTHVFIFNLAPRKDGTWGAIVSRELYKAQRRAGVEYRAALTRELGPRIASVWPRFRAMSNGRSRNGGRQSRRRRRSTGIGRLKAWS